MISSGKLSLDSLKQIQKLLKVDEFETFDRQNYQAYQKHLRDRITRQLRNLEDLSEQTFDIKRASTTGNSGSLADFIKIIHKKLQNIKTSIVRQNVQHRQSVRIQNQNYKKINKKIEDLSLQYEDLQQTFIKLNDIVEQNQKSIQNQLERIIKNSDSIDELSNNLNLSKLQRQQLRQLIKKGQIRSGAIQKQLQTNIANTNIIYTNLGTFQRNFELLKVAQQRTAALQVNDNLNIQQITQKLKNYGEKLMKAQQALTKFSIPPQVFQQVQSQLNRITKLDDQQARVQMQNFFKYINDMGTNASVVLGTVSVLWNDEVNQQLYKLVGLNTLPKFFNYIALQVFQDMKNGQYEFKPEMMAKKIQQMQEIIKDM